MICTVLTGTGDAHTDVVSQWLRQDPRNTVGLALDLTIIRHLYQKSKDLFWYA